MGPDALDLLAHDVLDACVACLDTIPGLVPGLAGAPDRAFVSPGEPVWDCCDQLAVNSPSIGEQFTSPTSPAGATARRHVFGRIPMVRIVTTVTRCIPQGEVVGTAYRPPTVADLEAAAAQIHADGWALHNGIYNRIAQGLLSDRCSEVAWDGLASATPAGGCAGWTFTLRFQLDGYGYTDPIGT
jgi:hypothetical protein